MSRYGKIESGFWQSKKTRRLSDDGRLLALYLFSCPHGNAVGCFVLHDGYVMADLGWDAERIKFAFRELGDAALAERDPDTLLVRVCGWWGHNTIDNANVAKHVVKEVSLLPDCEIKDRLIKAIKGIPNQHETVSETLSKGFGKQFRNHNTTEHNITQPNTDGAPRPVSAEDFEKFKTNYPKRGGSNPWVPAEDKFKRAIKSGADPVEIVLAAEIYARECDERKITGTEKVAQAVTWLNQQRWRDYTEGIEAERKRREQAEADMRARGMEWREGKWQLIETAA